LLWDSWSHVADVAGGIRSLFHDPHWWLRDIGTALIISVIVSVAALSAGQLHTSRPAARTAQSRRHLAEANLSNANLTDAKLNDGDLTGIHYDRDTVWPDSFKPLPRGANP
jgi:Pentapeptide repeats (8 copies)